MIKVGLKVLQANLDYYLAKLEEGEQIDVLENGISIFFYSIGFPASTKTRSIAC